MTTFKTPNGLELLTEWENYPRQIIVATNAARRLLKRLKVIQGWKTSSPSVAFGLPYTSSSAFAAVWNCCSTCTKKNDPSAYFEGIALTADNLPVAFYIVYDKEGNEIGELYEVID